MQSTLDKFFHKVNSIEETIPKAWLEPIPRSPTPVKRPVGRPRKRRDEVLEFEAELIVADEDTRSPRTPGTPSKRGKYTSYTPKQKTLIIDEAELIGLRAAARNWSVAPSTIATWKRDANVETQRNKNGRKVGSGRKLTYSDDVEERIVSWIMNRREQQVSVSRESIQTFAKSLVSESNPDFVASDGWLKRFMERNNFSLRKHTSLSQKLPADLELRLSVFYKHLRELREEHELDEDLLIINMDEVPMVFDTVPGNTVHRKGEKDVKVSTTGGEKKHFTAVLAVNAAGDFLPTLTIFKGKRAIKNLVTPPGWIVTVNDKAWMREETMLQWINEVLRPHTQRSPSLLVLDSFSAHITAKVRTALKKVNCYPAIIPGGCTSKAQHLDVAINKPFKDQIRKQWTHFMIERQTKINNGESNMKGPVHQDLINWMSTASKSVRDTGVIPKSFKVTGISTALSGIEDNMLHNDNILGVFDDDDDDDEEEFAGFDESDVVDSEDPFADIDECT